VREQVERLTGHVVGALLRRQPAGGTFHIEDSPGPGRARADALGEHDVARAYVLYREKRAQERAAQAGPGPGRSRCCRVDAEDGKRGRSTRSLNPGAGRFGLRRASADVRQRPRRSSPRR
jgi:ribonucleoside-diphosphate reductase alpha chain